MTQPIDTQTPSRRFFSRFLLLPGLMGGLSMLSSTLVLAQTETSIDTIVPTAQNSKPRTAAATPSAPRQSWRQRLRPEGSNSPTFSTRSQRVRERVADSSSRQQRLKRLSTVLSSGRQQRVREQVAEVVVPTRRQRVRLRGTNAPVPTRQQQVKSPTSIPPTTQLPIDRVPSTTTPPTNLPDQFLARPSVPKQTTISDSATEYNNTYIDRTNYNVGSTRGGYEAPSAIVLSERSTGCQAVAGQALSGSICGTPQERRALVARTRSSAINQSINVADATRIPNLAQPRWSNTPLPEGSSWASQSVVAGTFAGTPPVQRNRRTYATRRLPPAYRGSIAIQTPVPIRPPVAYYNAPTSQPPIGLPGYAYTGMVFPLSIPTPITSLFGWRVHPISGNQRFHTGTDLGAPLGTPVVAAFAGNVAIADYLGGYGLTVVLDHNEATQQTLYGHLSEIFVQPGQWVEQGTVIGRVGSTGNSTGPHLHFETRQLTPEGWVATDPGAQLEGTMALLVQTLQTAQLPAIPQPTAQLPVVPQQTAQIPERLPPVPQVPQEPNQLGS